MQAHVRSGAENPCHVLVFTWRENLTRNSIQTFGESCNLVACSTHIACSSKGSADRVKQLMCLTGPRVAACRFVLS